MIQPGSTLGDFELLDELGRGGMGVVYRARQVSLGREVAVKVLPAETVRQGNVAERFEAEARSMARLSHPAIASVYLVGEEEGSPFFAMQLLPGGTLEDRIRSGALSPEQAVSLAVRVAEGLDHAHSSGVIHRDIKPANILFDAQGQPVVTDFGIAKAADNVKLTATGMAVGTPQYMAPEQAKGNPSDHRADIYALGCVLYEMVCGRPPFSGETPVSIAVKHINEPPPPPRSFRADVPDWLESIILKALAKEPSDRFSTAADMARALNAKTLVGPVPAPVPTTAVPVGGGTIVMPPPGPPRINWLPAIIGLLALLGAGVIAGVAIRPHEPPAAPAPVVGGEPAANQEVPPDRPEPPQPSPEMVRAKARAELTDTYEELAGILADHHASNKPWDEYKASHRNMDRSWHNYLVAGGESLVGEQRDLAARWAALREKAQAVSVPVGADAGFGELRQLLIKCADAGEARMTRSRELMEEELAGGNPSWGKRTPYGQARQRFIELMGDGPEVGGKLRKLHDESFR